MQCVLVGKHERKRQPCATWTQMEHSVIIDLKMWNWAGGGGLE
jgi:hypothetical protein